MIATPPNPYRPPSETSRSPRPEVFRGGISSLRVCVQTIGGISLSGGVFALGMVLLSGFVNFPTSLDPDVFSVAVIAGAFGAVYASVCGVLTVPVLFFVGCYLTGRGAPWDGKRVRGFAAGAGAATGWLSVVAPSLPFAIAEFTRSPGSVLGIFAMAAIPAGVGSIGTLLVAERLARRASREAAFREQARAETDETAGGGPASLLTPAENG